MEKKSEESRSVFWEGLKVFRLVCLLLRPLLSNLKKQPLLMHAYRAVLYILLYSIYLDPRHEFSFFFFVPYYRMNAYMAALSVALFNCCFNKQLKYPLQECKMCMKEGSKEHTTPPTFSLCILQAFLLYYQQFQRLFYFIVITLFNC